MIPYEDFYYGTSTGFNFKVSNGTIKKTLTQQSLERLTNLRLKKDQTDETYVMHFPTEDIISITRLTRKEDSYGNRDGQDNHTILIKLTDYLKHFDVFGKFPPQNLVKEIL